MFLKVLQVSQHIQKKLFKFYCYEDIQNSLFRKNSLVFHGISWYILVFTPSVLTNRLKISSHFINFAAVIAIFCFFFQPPLLAQKFSTNISSIFHLFAKLWGNENAGPMWWLINLSGLSKIEHGRKHKFSPGISQPTELRIEISRVCLDGKHSCGFSQSIF